MRLQVLLVEPDSVDRLYPFSATHCAWELRCGLYTILERWQHTLPSASVTVTSHRDLHVRSFVERCQGTPFQSLPTLTVNAAALLSPSVMRKMEEVCMKSTSPIVFVSGQETIGAFTPEPPTSPTSISAALDAAQGADVQQIDVEGKTISRLWQLLDCIKDGVRWDSELVTQRRDPNASIHPTCVIDEEHGPVIIGTNSTIHAFTVLTGPLVVADNCVVKSHSNIGHSVVGPVCKVSGEISDSIFHANANKQHDGFVGHSWIGEWCNLGSGTITSNLRITYGEVSVPMPWGKENSGRQFLGMLAADHVRTGIGTRIPTGAVIGPMSAVVPDGFSPVQVSPFSWVQGSQVSEYQPDKALSTSKKAMERRQAVLGPYTEAILREIHRQTYG